MRSIVRLDKTLDAKANFTETVFETLGVSNDLVERQRLLDCYTDYENARRILQSMDRLSKQMPADDLSKVSRKMPSLRVTSDSIVKFNYCELQKLLMDLDSNSFES